jgi:hypothetical protein
MGFCPCISHAGAAHANTRQIARGGYVLLEDVLILTVRSIKGTQLFYSIEK